MNTPTIYPDISSALFQLSEKVESPAPDRLVWVQKLDLNTLKTSDLVSIFRACRQSAVDSDFWVALCLEARNRNDFTPADIGTSASAIAHRYNKEALTNIEQTLIEVLCIQALPIVEQFPEKSLVGLLNALVMLKIYKDPVIERLCVVAKTRTGNFSEFELSLLLHSLSVLGSSSEEFEKQFRPLVGLLCLELPKRALSHESLSRTLSALVKLDKHDPVLMRNLCGQVVKTIDDFTPRNITETLNALALMCISDSALVQRLGRVAEVQADSFLPKDIAISLTSFARLNLTFGSSHRRLYAAAVAQADKFNSEDIVTTLNAMVEFNFCNIELVKALCKEAFIKAETFTPRHIAIFFNALGKFGVFDKFLILKLTDVALPKVADFDPRTLSTVMNSLVKMGFYDPVLVDRLRDEAMLRADEFSPEAMIGVLHALERLGVMDKALAQRMYEVTKKDSFDFQDYSLTELFAEYELETEEGEEKVEKKPQPRSSLGYYL